MKKKTTLIYILWFVCIILCMNKVKWSLVFNTIGLGQYINDNHNRHINDKWPKIIYYYIGNDAPKHILSLNISSKQFLWIQFNTN